MASILPQVYAALDGMTVTYSGRNAASTTPTVFTLSELPGTVPSAHLPCRLLLPLGQGGGTPAMEILPGGEITATWTITDLLLMDSAASGEGLYIYAPQLIAYIVAYADAIGKKWQVAYQWQTEAFTTSVTMLPGIYNYPSGSEAQFYGVKVDITVTEIF
jgi:hypothetical protein